jgi:hypothetical protein
MRPRRRAYVKETYRRTMLRPQQAVALLISTAIMLTSISIMNPVSAESSDCTGGLGCDSFEVTTGSNVIVMQELTAIWCDICAISNPSINDFTSERSAEVARIAYHPNDGIDHLGNRFSTLQTWHLGQNPTEAEYPTIWMDGNDRMSGIFTESQLHQAYLKSSGKRDSENSLSIEYSKPTMSEDNEIQISIEVVGLTAVNMTLVVTADNVQISNPGAFNGIKQHNDVAIAGITVNTENGSVEINGSQNGLEFGSWQNISDEKKVIVLKYTPQIDENGELEHSLNDLGAVIFSEDSDGNIIAAQQIHSVDNDARGLEVTTLVLGGVALVGLILATPLLKGEKREKMRDGSDSGGNEEE